MLKQKRLLLSVRPIPGESFNSYRFRSGELIARTVEKIPVQPEKLLSDLLKRQARLAMADVTQCEPCALPGHLARLDMLCDLCGHFMRHDLAATGESLLSGRQLMYPATVADFVACMELTRKNHRCPEFLHPAHDEFSEIKKMLETIAFFVSQKRENSSVESEVQS